MFYNSIFLLIIASQIIFSQNFWQKTSFPSGTVNNSVYSMLSVNNIVFAGTFTMGIYKTYDNGNSWVLSGLESQWIKDLKKDNNNNLYALSTGSNFGSCLFKSTDNGSNWTRIWERQGGFNCLYIDPNNNIYIGLQFFDGQGGVFKS